MALSWTGAFHSFEPSIRLRAIRSVGIGVDRGTVPEGLAVPVLAGGVVGGEVDPDDEGEVRAPGRTLVVGVALDVGFPGPVPQPSV